MVGITLVFFSVTAWDVRREPLTQRSCRAPPLIPAVIDMTSDTLPVSLFLFRRFQFPLSCNHCANSRSRNSSHAPSRPGNNEPAVMPIKASSFITVSRSLTGMSIA